MKNTFTRINNLRNPRGFTLLELLIVISIIAVLSVALVLVLNPAETLRKARDSQRIADLNTLKTALGIYVTSTTTPYLGSNTANTTCKATATAGGWGAAHRIFYSLPSATLITDTSLDGGTASAPASSQSATPGLTDATGWVPVNFDTLVGGSPISNLPIDPINTVASLTGVASTDLVYRYACAQSPLTFELNAQLESNAYTVADDKRLSDGGSSNVYYEVGTSLKILGATAGGTDF